ncbi:hypothetical protein Dimus_027955, partial [Dionaea muscipula]
GGQGKSSRPRRGEREIGLRERGVGVFIGQGKRETRAYHMRNDRIPDRVKTDMLGATWPCQVEMKVGQDMAWQSGRAKLSEQ